MSTDFRGEGGGGKEEENKAVVRRYVEEVFHAGNLDAIDEIWAPDLLWHGGSVGDFGGTEALKQTIGGLIAALPDIRLVEEDLFAEGDRVAGRWTVTGTHEGELFGVPPTGRQITWMGMDLYRMENGKIAEEWAGDDILDIMQQLGVVPQMGAS